MPKFRIYIDTTYFVRKPYVHKITWDNKDQEAYYGFKWAMHVYWVYFELEILG